MHIRHLSRSVFTAIGVLMSVSALFSINPGGVHSASASNGRSAPLAKASAAAQYGKLPLWFIANAGQVDSAVHFQVRSSGGTLSFESDGVMLALTPPALTLNLSPKWRGTSSRLPSPVGEGPGVRAIRLTFDHANPNASLTSADQLPGIANFFIGSDPSQWHTNVPTYAGVVYHDLYPGVDLQYGGHVGLLKGTYTVAAGVDPSIIRWQYAGADSAVLDPSSGSLRISAPNGVTLTEQAPVAWQMRYGVQMPVMVGYQVAPDGLIQFAPNHYDPSLPLVIDPGLDYSTYLGGSGYDQGNGIAVDGSGNAYVTGYTIGSFPTTPGAYQTTSGGGATDAFVSKLELTAPTISIAPPTLPNGTLNIFYSRTLSASSTDPADVTLALSITSGALPPALNFNTNTGVLSGTPTTEGVYSFTNHWC